MPAGFVKRKPMRKGTADYLQLIAISAPFQFLYIISSTVLPQCVFTANKNEQCLGCHRYSEYSRSLQFKSWMYTKNRNYQRNFLKVDSIAGWSFMYQCCFSSIRGLRVKESGLTLSEQGHPCVCVYVCVCVRVRTCVCVSVVWLFWVWVFPPLLDKR